MGPTPDSIDVDASGWVIRYPDGAYNSGAGNANGFPVRYAEATIYETRREAEIKAEDLGDVEILAVPRAKPITEFSSEWSESAGTPSFGSNLRKPLTVEQRESLERQLKREDLQIFTVVRMAQKDLAKAIWIWRCAVFAWTPTSCATKKNFTQSSGTTSIECNSDYCDIAPE